MKKDPVIQFETVAVALAQKLRSLLSKERGFKLRETLHITFKAENDVGEVTLADPYLNSKANIVLHDDDDGKFNVDALFGGTSILPSLGRAFRESISNLIEWQSEGSRWVIDSIISRGYIKILTSKS